MNNLINVVFQENMDKDFYTFTNKITKTTYAEIKGWFYILSNDNIENPLPKDLIIFNGKLFAIKNNVGETIKIRDKEGLLTNQIIEKLKAYEFDIFFNKYEDRYFLIDFIIDDIWFESEFIDLENQIVQLNIL